MQNFALAALVTPQIGQATPVERSAPVIEPQDVQNLESVALAAPQLAQTTPAAEGRPSGFTSLT